MTTQEDALAFWLDNISHIGIISTDFQKVIDDWFKSIEDREEEKYRANLLGDEND
jgi:hypothetical protein